MIGFASFTALAVLGLLWAEWARAPRWTAVWKTLASLGFVAAAWLGAEGAPTPALLWGLLACALGDVLLLPAGSGPWFLAGMASFALGHACYLAAFAAADLAPWAAVAAFATMTALMVPTLRWLAPHLPPAMRAPVRAYLAIITCMVAAAVGASASRGDLRASIGALAFAASDLSVARDRFVRPGFANVLWGLPLYYAAQLVLAWLAGAP